MLSGTTLKDSSTEESNCSICLGALTTGKPLLTLSCAHQFHLHCLMTCVKAQHDECPLCRTVLEDSLKQLLSESKRGSQEQASNYVSNTEKTAVRSDCPPILLSEDESLSYSISFANLGHSIGRRSLGRAYHTSLRSTRSIIARSINSCTCCFDNTGIRQSTTVSWIEYIRNHNRASIGKRSRVVADSGSYRSRLRGRSKSIHGWSKDDLVETNIGLYHGTTERVWSLGHRLVRQTSLWSIPWIETDDWREVSADF